MVQQHAARRMHWDFRLELDGVLKSWAVPKGPSLVAGEKRMAVATEDHPLAYADFEGVIPKGEYGGGTVLVWDSGLWEPVGDPHRAIESGKLDFDLCGEKLRGRWHLVRMRPRASERGRASWLLIKSRDAYAREACAGGVVAQEPYSVLTGRDLAAVARDADRTWSSGSRAVASRERPRAAARERRAPLPRDVAVELATLVEAPPEGPEWLHEIKLDGYRLLCFLENGSARLVSRNGHDWTARFPSLASALAELPARQALLDGEAVVFAADGRSRFQALQEALGRGRAPRDVALVLFDCLHLDGRDLRAAPLLERKRALRSLLDRAPRGTPLRFSDHLVGRGAEFYAAACERGVEGVVSKRVDAPHRDGRSRAWQKIRCSKRQEFLIVGFTRPRGSRIGFGALLLGAHDAAGALRYCGKVGTGFGSKLLRDLHQRLSRLERPRPEIADPPRLRDVHWVAPRLVAEISFSEWTRDGRVRHPVFLGLREDKPPSAVRIEVAQPASRTAPAPRRADAAAGSVAGVPLTHPDRVYFPDLGVTKRELAQYYEAMADRVLPGLVQRPLTLLRCPDGIAGDCFYQKAANQGVPEEVGRVRVRGDKGPYAMVTDLPSLVSLVQIGVLELHVWGARADRLDRPDLLVFDLDPDPAVRWARVVETAGLLREYLRELGLVAFARVTGGKGVHVVVPLVRRSGWEDVRRFSRGIARELASLAPELYTAQMSKAHRRGKIFIDWVRNNVEATAIASYSVRARPGAPVALPLAWEELAALRKPLHESVREALRRLDAPDPWARFEASRRAIPRTALRRFATAH